MRRPGRFRLDAATNLILWIVSLPAPIVWLILAFASGIEYVIPPFPGDAIVLGGGVLAGSQAMSYIPVFAAVTIGSVLGAWLDFEVGRWLASGRETWLHRLLARPKVARAVERITAGFKAHGDLYLVINRFLPGLRAFFFLAAGLAGLGRARVLVLATVAAMLWNALILGVGLSVGANLEVLLELLDTYARFAWIAVGVVVALLVLRFVIRDRLAKDIGEEDERK